MLLAFEHVFPLGSGDPRYADRSSRFDCGDITPEEFLSFYAVIGYFTGPVSELVGMNKVIQDALLAADGLFEIMHLEKEEKGQKV